jgi:hypothetical protein
VGLPKNVLVGIRKRRRSKRGRVREQDGKKSNSNDWQVYTYRIYGMRNCPIRLAETAHL